MSEASKLDGQKFTALNGGPLFRFTEAVSVKKLGIAALERAAQS